MRTKVATNIDEGLIYLLLTTNHLPPATCCLLLVRCASLAPERRLFFEDLPKTRLESPLLLLSEGWGVTRDWQGLGAPEHGEYHPSTYSEDYNYKYYNLGVYVNRLKLRKSAYL